MKKYTAIRMTFTKVGKGWKFIVEDADAIQYEQYVLESNEMLLNAVASWLKKQTIVRVDTMWRFFDYNKGVVFSFNKTMPEFLDECPLANLREVDELGISEIC